MLEYHRRRFWRTCTTVLAVLYAWACGGSANRVFDDAKLLKFGVHPPQEADRLAAHFGERGRRISRRIDHASFSAFALQDREGDGTGVRVITERGIQLAFDAGARHGHPNLQLTLMEAEIEADGGCEDRVELFVAGEDVVSARRCIQGYRILENGHLDAVALEGPAWEHALCVGALVDLDGDGCPEGLLEVSLPDLATEQVPRLELPVQLVGSGFAWHPTDAGTAVFMAEARARMEAALERARTSEDAETAYRLGIERAAHAHFDGEGKASQLEALDEALRGLTLSPSQARAHANARRYIQAGWQPLPSEEPALDPE